MASNIDDEPTGILENLPEIMEELSKELAELQNFRNYFFENHPIEMANAKHDMVNAKKEALLEKFDRINVDTQIPIETRAEFLYLKGRCYNISAKYDARASQCLSRAVKLNPQLVGAWNELGESYWKNMNVVEAKASFEGALKHERNCIALRSLSILLRQEDFPNSNKSDIEQAIIKSVEYGKEAVALNPKDGMSWTVLGNAYLCQYFLVGQDPATLKLSLSAYKQAMSDPVAKGQADLYFNRATALKYEECYSEALENFEYASRLDPLWDQPKDELKKFTKYLTSTHSLVWTMGKIKAKRIGQMVKSIDKRHIGVYSTDNLHTFGSRKNVTLELTGIAQLQEGSNPGKVIMGRVVGSVHVENAVPFTFGLVDESMACVCVTVYNWADGRGAIIDDTVVVPEPYIKHIKIDNEHLNVKFKSIRVNNPLSMLINGKRVGTNQFASTRVTSTYQIH